MIVTGKYVPVKVAFSWVNFGRTRRL